MNIEEQKAFVKAYSNNVAHNPDDFVADFIAKYNLNQDIDYSYEHTSIMDALGMWHDAIKWKLNELNKNS
jgi:hypothetical protein